MFFQPPCVNSSEAGGSVGADDLTRLAPNIPESVRELAGEVIGFARAEHTRVSCDCHLEAPAYHYAAFLAAMNDHLIAGASPRSIALMKDRELPSRTLSGKQTERHFFVAQLYEFIRGEKSLGRRAQVQREERG